jgi:hypothetical protein
VSQSTWAIIPDNGTEITMGWEIGGIPGPYLINLFVRDLNVLDVIG